MRYLAEDLGENSQHLLDLDLVEKFLKPVYAHVNRILTKLSLLKDKERLLYQCFL